MKAQRSELAQVPERLLAKLWQQRASGAHLQAAGGQRIWVVYGGRPGGGRGPDFRDALVRVGEKVVRGDVELHRRAGGWRQHGHHLDPAYDHVVVHGVGEAQKESPSGQADTGPGAQVCLSPLTAVALPRTPHPWRRLAQLPPAALAAALDRAGQRRFLERSAAFSHRHARWGEEQELYAALLEGLGYSENRAPFRELARRVPFALVRSVARAASSGPSCYRDVVEEVLLSGSGLEQPGAWWRRMVGTASMSPDLWRCVGVRPSNHPMRRIRGAAALVARMVPSDSLAWLAAVVESGRPEALVEELSVTDCPDRHGALVGRSRAGDLAVNVVLPWMRAASRARGDVRRASLCLRLYHLFPALQDNGVIREARTLLGAAAQAVPMTACRQQGLHHLYRRMLEAAPPSQPLDERGPG